MRVFALGLSHRTAPLEMREQVAFTRAELPGALLSLKSASSEAVILSTCNRTELYSIAPDGKVPRDELVSFMASKSTLSEDDLSRYLYFYEQEEAVRHLFRVVSGLDSMILGEAQIQGQVRDAFSVAVAQGCANGAISKVFHHSLRVGKRARRETRIGENALSISSAAVEMARQVLGEIHQRRVIVVGAGEAGKLVARAMRDRGAGRIVVVNRTLERAQDLAQELGGEAAPFDSLERLLGTADIVVSSTDSPGLVLPSDLVARALARRDGAPLLVVDIAVPRDADPAIAQLPGVSLLDLDDLQNVSLANRREREREASLVEAIVDEEVSRFSEWWDSLSVAPGIAQLREQAEHLRILELRRTLKQMPHLSEEDVAHIETLSKAIIKKLLHRPIVAIKEDPGYLPMAQELFGLNGKKH